MGIGRHISLFTFWPDFLVSVSGLSFWSQFPDSDSSLAHVTFHSTCI
jgi:hypothetical protein